MSLYYFQTNILIDQQGLGDQCLRVKQLIGRADQVLLFSATFPDQVMGFAHDFCPNANEIKLKRDELTVAGIQQMYMDCTGYVQFLPFPKVLARTFPALILFQFILEYGSLENANDAQRRRQIRHTCSALRCSHCRIKHRFLQGKLRSTFLISLANFFPQRKDTASGIADRLRADGHEVLAVHSAFDGAERDAIVKKFRDGEGKVLITTNVLARGIDVSTVSMVINYDIPMKGRNDSEPDPETYLHRIGRTGRFGRVGVSISFVFDKTSFRHLETIARTFGIDLQALRSDDWEATEATIKRVIRSSRAGTNLKA